MDSNTILVIDDDELIRFLLTEELEDDGFSVVTDDGESNLVELIEKVKPCVVILDIKLKHKNGLELLPNLREVFYDLPIIMFSAYETFKSDPKSIAADYYVVKSNNLQSLKEAINKALIATEFMHPVLSTTHRRVVRSFHFNEITINAGKYILNQISSLLKKKYSNIDVKVESQGFATRLSIGPEEFEPEEIAIFLNSIGSILSRKQNPTKKIMSRRKFGSVLNSTRNLLDTSSHLSKKQDRINKKLTSDFFRYIGNRLSKVSASIISCKLGVARGVLIDKSCHLIFNIANHGFDTINSINVTILESGDFDIESSPVCVITSLNPGNTVDCIFEITPRTPGEITINIKINNEVVTPSSRIYVIEDNPYVYGDPIQNPHLFFGRADKLSETLQAVLKTAKQDILVVGEIRSGKTSFLYKIQDKITYPYIPIYINLATVVANFNNIINLIFQSIVAKMNKHNLLNEYYYNDKYNNNDLIKSLYNLFSASNINGDNVKIILLLDEADVLRLVDNRLQNVLRALLQSQEVGSNIRAIIAGTNELKLNINRVESPLYNHCKFIKLTALNENETTDLIVKPMEAMGYFIDEDAVNDILDACGGHPYYCQRICYDVFIEASNNKMRYIDKSLVSECISNLSTGYEDESFIIFRDSYWKALSHHEKNILYKIATSTKITAKPLEYNKLIDKQLICREGDRLKIISRLFLNWSIYLYQSKDGADLDNGKPI